MNAVCLMGPTASGKSAMALQLAETLPLELVSVDSAQVYRGMDIGTAKPSRAERERVPHWLIDIREPQGTYSAGDFCRDAEAAMSTILGRGRVPLLVGGTMLYFRALQQGLARLPVADPELRRELDERAARLGWPALHAELAALDPATAARLRPTDAQRIQRALEVCLLSGRSMAALHAEPQAPARLRFLNLALLPDDRPALHARIESRLQSMVQSGLLDEIDRLGRLPGMHAGLPSMRSVGYRQLWPHVFGDQPLSAAMAAAATATRRLAKRQLTWLRPWPALRIIAEGVPVARVAEDIRVWLDTVQVQR